MTWSRVFFADETMHALVSESEGRRGGLTHYLFHRTTTRIEPTCYLQDLFTIAEQRGTGVGRALISSVFEQARLAGCARVYWLTHESNATAMKLYDRLAQLSGFVVYRKEL